MVVAFNFRLISIQFSHFLHFFFCFFLLSFFEFTKFCTNSYSFFKISVCGNALSSEFKCCETNSQIPNVHLKVLS